MPWLNKVAYDKNHICKMPDIQSAGIGSKWECDHCQAVYRISQPFVGQPRKWQFMYYKIPEALPGSEQEFLGHKRSIYAVVSAPPYLMD